MRYKYTGDLPAVTPFQHGQEGLTLTRAESHEEESEVGTIVIEPGDILELAEPDDIIVHAHFELLDPPEEKAETDAQRKAREKREAKAAEAKVAKPADAAPAAAPQDSSLTPAHPVAAPILTPQAGADGFGPGAVICLNGHGRETLGDTDLLGQIEQLATNVAENDSALVHWADGTESTISLSLIEIATDDPASAGIIPE